MTENSSGGQIFYGKHFYPGVAEYADTQTRVLVKEDAIRKMNPSFKGKPVFVGHVGDEIDNLSLDELKKIQDGWVIRSFYNEADGATWTEFIVDSQKGLDAIKKGFKLSNAYSKELTDNRRGLYSGQNYDEELLDGKFHHLAIVENPRYSDSIILTPEEFKKYNEEKKTELDRLQNSLDLNNQKKQESLMSFNFFKKTRLDNALDFEGLCVELPKTKREVAIADLIKEADVDLKEIKDAPIVLINEEKEERMTIDEAITEIKNLRNKCNELEEKLKANEDKKDEEKKDNEEDKKDEEKKDNSDGEPAKENEEDKKDDKKENEEDKDKKENADGEPAKCNTDDKKENEEDKKDDETKVNKNFLNEIVNANKICENSPSRQDILLPDHRAELARKLF